MGLMRLRAGVVAKSLVAIVISVATSAGAESWPQRPVRLIVPSGPGSSPDVAARLFADRLSDRWKQPVVVENRTGAEGVIGVSAFVNMHDNHTLLASFAGPITVLPVIQDKLPYDPSRDLVPISSMTDTFATIAVPTSLGIGSLADLVTQARSQPGKFNYHAAAGAFPILFAGFVKGAGLDMVAVSYRDSILSTQDLIEGRIQIAITSLTNVLPQAQAGKVRLLAVTNNRRSSRALDVPTAIEAGYPDLSYEAFSGIFGSRNMPAALRDSISADVRAAANSPSLVDRLSAVGLVAHGSTPAEFSTAIQEQRAKMLSIVKLLGVNPAQ
jgi:tripartite-type tricarboxylate transporter receptor subunit TctC